MIKFLFILTFFYSQLVFASLVNFSKDVIESKLNRSETPLAAGATWTGSWDTDQKKPQVTFGAKTDQDGELCIDFRKTGGGTTVSTLCYSVTANINEIHSLNVGGREWRLRFENTSASDQTSFDTYAALGNFSQLTAPSNLSQGQDADAIMARTTTMEQDIAMGKRVGFILVQKFGKNNDVDTGTVPEDLWTTGGTYTGFPSERELVEVVSSSANDTAAGTGCRTVFISGLDSNFEIQTETVTLNGTTPVDSVGTYARLNRAYCVTSGSGNKNAGDITIRHTTTTANVFAQIIAGDGQTEVGCYTVPAGYTGYLKHYRYSMFDSTANRATISFFAKLANGNELIVRPQSVSTEATLSVQPYGGLVFAEMTDGCGRVTAIDNSNGQINFSFEMILVKN